MLLCHRNFKILFKGMLHKIFALSVKTSELAYTLFIRILHSRKRYIFVFFSIVMYFLL